jgi:prephenate dehydrogenase
MYQPKTIGIIGGSGKLGSKFAELFQKNGYQVLIAGRKTKLTYLELTKKSDVIFVCVPIANTVEIIEEITPALTKNKLISDFTSIKVEPVKAMLKSKACVIGTHPIFAPHLPFAGQNIAVCPERPGKFLPWLTDIFKKAEMKIFLCSPEEQDKLMGQIQSLTHFLHITFARTLFDSKANFQQIKKLESPIYRLSYDIFCRILSFDPDLYGQILTENSAGKKLLKMASKNASNLQKIIENKDLKKFNDFFNETAEFLGDFKKEAKKESDYLSKKLIEYDQLKSENKKEITKKNFHQNLLNITQKKSKEKNNVNSQIATQPFKLNLDQPSILALGPELTFSDLQIPIFQQILIENEAGRPKILLPSFSAIVDTLKNNPEHLAIVPIENSIQGDVTEILDEIYHQDFEIIAGHWQKIAITLGGTKEAEKNSAENITKIFAHSQLLFQAKKFLKKKYPNAQRVPMSSNAEGIRYVAEQQSPNFLAIGPKEAIDFFQLKTLAENIEDSPNNQTFFVLIKNKNNSTKHFLKNEVKNFKVEKKLKEKNKFKKISKNELTKNNLILTKDAKINSFQLNYETALAFTFSDDKPASLFSVLQIFAQEKINLTKIVSRPTGEKKFHYVFYLNFQGRLHKNKILFNKIKSQTSVLKILGEYIVF